MPGQADGGGRVGVLLTEEMQRDFQAWGMMCIENKKIPLLGWRGITRFL